MRNKMNILRIIYHAALIISGIALILGSASQSNYEDPVQRVIEQRQKCESDLSKADLEKKPSNYKAIIIGYLNDNLKDPYSAMIDWAKLSGPTPGFGNLSDDYTCNIGWTMCVAVNAKNSYGGYIGSSRWSFIIRNNSVIYANSGNEIPNFYQGCK